MKKIFALAGSISVLIVLMLTLNLTSCNSTKNVASEDQTNMPEAMNPQEGVQLWANNCVRCHNAPPPSAYNDTEWTAITNHMQKVAGLTEDEANKIEAYIKSSN